jgi:hypothetical protein
VQLLLSEHGYDVLPNRIIQGRCVTHEVDAIATKDNKTCFVEVKHHFKYHTPTSLDVSRIARAVYEDVTEGYDLGKNSLKIDYAMIVCNTKLSEHAKKYANCRNIQHIAWSTATNQDLQTLIETKKLYPITFLKQVNANTRDKLATNGVVMLKQLTQQNPTELKAKTGLSRDKLLSIFDAARTVLS